MKAHGPWYRLQRFVAAAVAAAALLATVVVPAAASAAQATALPLSAAQVAAIGGNLTPWQIRWLETGGASGVPAAGAAEAPMIPATPATDVEVWSDAGFVATTTASGSCFTGSIAAVRVGAYRCTVGNALSDPCFVTTDATAVDCPSGDPADHSGLQIQLSAPLPGDASTAASAARPWYFTLQGGGTCGAMTGTLVDPDHPFGCSIPATASAAALSVYCTVPAKTAGEAYTVGCAPVAAQPAANGAPQLEPDSTYTVATAWY